MRLAPPLPSLLPSFHSPADSYCCLHPISPYSLAAAYMQKIPNSAPRSEASLRRHAILTQRPRLLMHPLGYNFCHFATPPRPGVAVAYQVLKHGKCPAGGFGVDQERAATGRECSPAPRPPDHSIPVAVGPSKTLTTQVALRRAHPAMHNQDMVRVGRTRVLLSKKPTKEPGVRP